MSDQPATDSPLSGFLSCLGVVVVLAAAVGTGWWFGARRAAEPAALPLPPESDLTLAAAEFRRIVHDLPAFEPIPEPEPRLDHAGTACIWIYPGDSLEDLEQRLEIGAKARKKIYAVIPVSGGDIFGEWDGQTVSGGMEGKTAVCMR
jgi:hypothetical protein